MVSRHLHAYVIWIDIFIDLAVFLGLNCFRNSDIDRCTCLMQNTTKLHLYFFLVSLLRMAAWNLGERIDLIIHHCVILHSTTSVMKNATEFSSRALLRHLVFLAQVLWDNFLHRSSVWVGWMIIMSDDVYFWVSRHLFLSH